MGLSTFSIKIPSVPTLHKTPYPSISPLRPELSQAGRTVLIAGGSAGIGFAIARGFVQAKASRVILLGRRHDAIQAAADKLNAECADKDATTVTGISCDIADLKDTAKLWDHLKAQGIIVDVLVLNAAVTGSAAPILQSGLEKVWNTFEVNVRTLMDFTERLWKQEGGGKKVCLPAPFRPRPILTSITVRRQRLHFGNSHLGHRV
jgi:NAD(P)-dependent dehydrogenase (short-subunit alcohol dehydrogenase family)